MTDNKKQELSENEVFSVLEFANYLYNPTGAGYNLYTPELLYDNLLNLNVLPKKTNYDRIIVALENAKDNAKELQGYSQFLENVSMTYKKTLEYYTNLLSFDMYWTVVEAKDMTAADYKSKAYKSDLNRLYRFTDNFDYKREFLEIVLNMLRREVVYTWFRRKNTDSNKAKYTLQKMPQDRFMMTGYWERGILADFDMQYFLKPGVDIDAFDPKFKELFNQVFIDSDSQDKYIPTNPFSRRDGSFATWTQLSPDDGLFVFKRDMSTFDETPFLTPFMKDCLYAEDTQALQKDKNMLSAHAILTGEIEMLDKQKSGNTQNATAFTPQVLGQFLALARQAISDNNVKIAALPFNGTKWSTFEDKNEKMYNDAISSVVGQGVSASRVIYSSDKVSQAELEAQITNDYYLMEKLYRQFENFMNFWVNKTMRKYHFNIHFTGCTQSFIRQDKFDQMTELADRGIVLNESYIASCIGVEPQEFSRMLAEGNKGGIIDKLTPLSSIHTQGINGSGVSKKRGRPKKRDALSTESRDYQDTNARRKR